MGVEEMKKILSIVLILLIMTSLFMMVYASEETPSSSFTDIKIDTSMYYLDAKKTVINENGIAVSISDSNVIAYCDQLSIGNWKTITFKKSIEMEDIIIVDNKFIAVAGIGLDSLAFPNGLKLLSGYPCIKLFSVDGYNIFKSLNIIYLIFDFVIHP